MISTLNLQGSEGLEGSLTDLAQINILVGKNAAGKTRVLRAIQSSLGTKLDAQDATTPERLTPPLTGIVKVLEMRSTSTPPLTDIEPVLEKLSLSPITTEIRTSERTEENGTTRRKITEEKEHFLHEGVDIDPQVSFFSGGTRAWARLRSDIEKFLEKPFGTRSPRDLLVLVIEDIEHGLHPGAQRQMLADIEKLIASPDIPVQVFVTTHSPFIVAGLAKLTTPGKVYLIESGCPTDLFFRAGSVEACRGFGATQAQLMTNYLLGSELSDWFPSSVVICENSLAVLLTELSSRFNVPLPVYFLHESGDARALEAGAVITDFLSNMEKVFATPPMRYLLSFELVVLTDGRLSIGDEKLIQNLKNKGLKVRAKQVGDKSELEAHYPQEICEEALNESGIPAWSSGDLTAHLKCYYKTLGQTGKSLKDSVGTFKEILAKKVAKEATQEQLQFALNFVQNELTS